MKLNTTEHKMAINRAIARVAFKSCKNAHKWVLAMSALREVYMEGVFDELANAMTNHDSYGDETIRDADKKQNISIINTEYTRSVINHF